MLLKMSKAKKRLFAAFSIILSGLLIFPAAAVDYEKLPIDVVESIEVSTFWRDWIRSASFGILKTLAWFVDKICEAIETISNGTAYALLAKAFPNYTVVMPIAVATICFAVCLAGLFLMFNADKLTISDTLKHSLIALIFIVALPSFIGACEDIRDRGVKTSSDVAQSSELASAQSSNNVINDGFGEVTTTTGSGVGIKHYLGEQIIAKNMIDIAKSETSVKHFSESDDYKSTNNYIYQMNYNRTLDNKVWDQKVLNVYDVTRFSEGYSGTLNSSDVAVLVGYSYTYNIYINNRRYKADSYGPYSPYVYYNEVRYTNDQYGSIEVEKRASDYLKENLIPEILRQTPVIEAISRGLISSDEIINASNYQQIENLLKSKVTPLITASSTSVTSSTLSNGVYYAQTLPLFTEQDWKTLSDVNSLSELGALLKHLISNLGTGIEYIYAYKIDFWKTFITLILVAIALIFAGIKLATMLYDMLFMNLIAPIVIATDVYGSGRAKKMITELLNTYIVFYLVVLVLKIYIITVTAVMNSNMNLIAQLMLILAGAKFVIDGPDIIVKLTGTDAGVKSGYGALMGMRAATSMASGAVRTTTHTAKSAVGLGKSAVSAPGSVAGKIAGRMDGYKQSSEASGKSPSNIGTFVKGGILGMGGQGTAGQAFRQARNQSNYTNDEYIRRHSDNNSNDTNNIVSDNTSGNNTASEPANSSSNSASAAAVKGEKGDQGERGERGLRGDKGDRGDKGVQEKSGKNEKDEQQNNISSAQPGETPTYGNAFNVPSSSGSSDASAQTPTPTYAETQAASEQNTGFAQSERITETAPASEGYAQKERASEAASTNESFAQKERKNETSGSDDK